MRAQSVLVAVAIAAIFAGRGEAADAAAAVPPSPAAIAKVQSGQVEVADALWWGFDPQDATASLQSAIDSRAKTVVVPYVGSPWILKPIRLRGHLELILAPGVVLLAKKGEFRGPGDCLLRAADASDITLRGYRALIRMRKADYQRPPYPRGEWRMGVGFYGCQHVRVEGLRVESTGGDGIYVGSGSGYRPSEDVVIRDCVCHDNHRQGISVTNVRKLLVENCVLSHTSGTPPEAGIDFEPDIPQEELTDCVVRRCLFQDNAGHAILVYLNPLTSKSRPVSIRFEGCVSRMGEAGMSRGDFRAADARGWSGMAVGTVRDDGPKGLVEFRDCVAENTGREGAKIYDKSAQGVRVRFVNCSWKDAWISNPPHYAGPRVPVLLELRDTERTAEPGGIEFVNCHVYDDLARPPIAFHDDTHKSSLHQVTGDITAHGGRVAEALLGRTGGDVHLTVRTVR